MVLANPTLTGQIGEQSQFGMYRTWYLPNVHITMHKQHLLRILERTQHRQKLPTTEDIWPWASLLAAFVMATVANDPRDFLMPPNIWQTLYIAGAVWALSNMVRVLLQVKATKAEREKTPEVMFGEILAEAQREMEALAEAEQHAKQLGATQPSSGTSDSQPGVTS